jgi:hypothetical protein
MSRKKKSDTQWEQPASPPPPLFTGKKEKDFVKQVNDELIERVIGQQIAYFAIDIDRSPFHPIYGEAIQKTFLPPVRVHALIKWEGQTNLFTDTLGIDKQTSFEIHFHKRRLTEDQNLFVREGDYVLYGDRYYEIVSTAEPKQLFGQAESRFEIVAKCIRAREGVFNPQFTAGTVTTKQESTTTATPTYGGNGIVRPSGGGGSTAINATFNSLTTNTLTVNSTATFNASIIYETKLISGSYTVISTDYIIGVDTDTTTASILLPAVSSTIAGRYITIKDETGNATTNFIHISASTGDTIDEQSVFTLDADFGAVNLYCTSTGWHVI